MNKQVKQIKAEIERRIKDIKILSYPNNYDNAALQLYKGLLSFIGSLEEELLSEDLENKICQLAEEYTLYGQSDYIRLKTALTNLANWQKEQMLNDGIECTIDDDIDMLFADYTNFDEDEYIRKQGLKPGDKVKVIIVKEE